MVNLRMWIAINKRDLADLLQMFAAYHVFFAEYFLCRLMNIFHVKIIP
ncbi:hypothetical protein EBL_c38150 [Shimwellia blattae DSM 4481 = NBRC 105725]|uniref:Uncharacterized protein n=1 Tax=Shimwellia blattae (strain ATCC 29907 / DSM 4481 / JCM 1650 / NBRC 105725 / CDC 9005-74) TaxID=630626 RepID=I2BE96_SHIBC|nr:hypothetical protein EBL_c38150 [Shimwellia blattae DSM 4481 = NBRC 105725]